MKSQPLPTVAHNANPPCGVSEGVAFEQPELKLNCCTPRAPARAVVVVNEKCTASAKSASVVRHVAFDVSNTPLAGAMYTGQCFGVIPPGTDPNGKPHKVRLYSCSSPSAGEDGAGNVIATCCKRLIDEHWETHRLFLGIASNYICDLQVGEEVLLTGPVGKRFILPANAEAFNYVFFATGTGIAPFRAMVLDLLQRGVDRPIVLFAGVPYATDLIYHRELTELAEANPHFRYVTAVSREAQADGHRRMYVHDRIVTERKWLTPILDDPRTLIYICGLAGMELGICQQLARVLTPDRLEQYLTIAPELADDIDAWSLQAIGRRITRTEQVLVEVYD